MPKKISIKKKPKKVSKVKKTIGREKKKAVVKAKSLEKKRKPVKKLAEIAIEKPKEVAKIAPAEEVKKLPAPIWTTGKRKNAIAKVQLLPGGRGEIFVNKKDYKEYFPWFEFQEIVTSPLKKAGQVGKFQFRIKASGGGTRGQAEAVRLGIARALDKLNHEWHEPLKRAGFLTRDARKKERKKPGLKRARRAPQWQKR